VKSSVANNDLLKLKSAMSKRLDHIADSLDGVEFRTVGRQRHQMDVRGLRMQLRIRMKPCLIPDSQSSG